MSILDRAAKPVREPFVGTIVGVQGTGKTSLACTFPRVIMLRTQGEKPPQDIPADQTPTTLEIESAQDLWDALKALLREDHAFKTLVVDSVTGIESLFTQDVLASDPSARGLNQALGGWGAGTAAVTAMHLRLRKASEMLRKQKGMNIVFLAHADIQEVSPPDSDAYSAYSLRLPKKSTSPYLDSVDCVAFLKQVRAVKGAVEAKGDRGAKPGRAISSGDRVLVTYLTPAMCSKNRYGITEDLEVEKGVNPLAFVLEEAPKAKAKSKPTPVETDEDEAAEAALDAIEGVN